MLTMDGDEDVFAAVLSGDDDSGTISAAAAESAHHLINLNTTAEIEEYLLAAENGDLAAEINAAPTKPAAKKRKKATESASERRLKKSTVESQDAKKQRVHRYCPKLEEMTLNLECEWDDCDFTVSCVDSFLKHIDEHIEQYLTERTSASDENFECQWRECDCASLDDESTFQRHVRFHAFHTKLKQIGENVLQAAAQEGKPDAIPRCNLDEQTRNLIPDLPYKFECAWNGCAYTNDDPELFYRHIRLEHVDTFPSKVSDGKCLWSECSQPLTQRFRLAEHIRHHSQEKLAACPVCGALFSSFTRFLDHCSRSAGAESSSLRFQCSHCNKKFATNNLLKEHTRKHINKYKCPICDMTCTEKNDLRKHILYKHTTQKAFSCAQCDYKCKTHHDLEKHVNLKHNEHYEYQCDECEFKTKSLPNIKRHMVKFHLARGENGADLMGAASDIGTGSYMCHVCNKIYSQSATLSRHLKTRHNFQWPSGLGRFRYKLESDGYYRLQTMRYESIELVEQLNKDAASVLVAAAAAAAGSTVASTPAHEMEPIPSTTAGLMEPDQTHNPNSLSLFDGINFLSGTGHPSAHEEFAENVVVNFASNNSNLGIVDLNTNFVMACNPELDAKTTAAETAVAPGPGLLDDDAEAQHGHDDFELVKRLETRLQQPSTSQAAPETPSKSQSIGFDLGNFLHSNLQLNAPPEPAAMVEPGPIAEASLYCGESLTAIAHNLKVFPEDSMTEEPAPTGRKSRFHHHSSFSLNLNTNSAFDI